MKRLIVNSMPSFFIKAFASPYVAGNSLKKAVSLSDSLFKEKKIYSTLDVLGEEERNKDEIAKTKELYLNTLEAIAGKEHTSISVKPSHFGYFIEPATCEEIIEQIAIHAFNQKTEMTIDMEDTNLTDWTLNLYRKLKPKYSNLTTVLQSRLFRTENDINSMKGITGSFRLCIGIYNVPAKEAYQDKTDMKDNMIKLLRILLSDGHFVAVATHDEGYIQRALSLIEEMKIPPGRVEFQMLLGVPRDRVQKFLIEKGYRVRLYLPFATHWGQAIAYLRRRMLNNPHMVIYVLKNLFG